MNQEIENHDFDPSSFEWSVCDSEIERDLKVPVIIHTPTRYFFIFDVVDSYHKKKGFKFHSVRSPGFKSSQDSRNDTDFDAVCDFFWDWIDLIKKNSQVSILWNTVEEERSRVQADLAIDINNSKFSDEELGIVSAKLLKIKEDLTQQYEELAKNQQNVENRYEKDVEFFKQQFELLNRSAKQLGRKDWIQVVYNTFLTISVSAGFNDTSRIAIFNFLVSSFHLILEFLKQLPR